MAVIRMATTKFADISIKGSGINFIIKVVKSVFVNHIANISQVSKVLCVKLASIKLLKSKKRRGDVLTKSL